MSKHVSGVFFLIGVLFLSSYSVTQADAQEVVCAQVVVPCDGEGNVAAKEELFEPYCFALAKIQCMRQFQSLLLTRTQSCEKKVARVSRRRKRRRLRKRSQRQ